MMFRARAMTATLAVVPLTLFGALWTSSSPGGAATDVATTAIPIDYVVNATTTLHKLGTTVTVPPGTFIGQLNLRNDVLRGNLTLPPASTEFSIAGIGLAKATFVLSPVKPVIGTVDLGTLEVTATAVFNVDVASVNPLGLPINVVGNSCGTSQPVSVTFSGKFTFGTASSFSGKYTIPPLANCELLTPALNLLVAGPGNVFTASFSPATS
jgi:hypothetical protein